MLQDADSNDKHVMSSTQANAITANPLQFPFSTHCQVTTIVMKSHCMSLQVAEKLLQEKGQ